MSKTTEAAIVSTALRWFAEFMNKGRVSHTRYYELHEACMNHIAAKCKTPAKSEKRRRKA